MLITNKRLSPTATGLRLRDHARVGRPGRLQHRRGRRRPQPGLPGRPTRGSARALGHRLRGRGRHHQRQEQFAASAQDQEGKVSGRVLD